MSDPTIDSSETLALTGPRPSLLAAWAPRVVPFWPLGLVVLLVAGPPLYLMVHADGVVLPHPSDYPAHVSLIQTALKDGSWQPHFLVQWLVWALSGFSARAVALGWAMSGVALACVFAKAALTQRFFADTLSRQPGSFAARLGISRSTLALGLAVASLMLFPIAIPAGTSRIYLGQIAPNVWHNPTILVAWPLMLLLFFVSARQLERASGPGLAAVALLLVLNAIAKPNAVLVFVPAFALLALVRLRGARARLWTALAFLPVLATLILQWRWAYSHESRLASATASIVFAPFQAWRLYTTSVVASTLRSIAFPLAYVALYPRSLRRSTHLGLAWAIFLFGWLWLALAAESGDRISSLNFSWGAHLASYILFIATIADWLQRAPGDSPLPPTVRRLGVVVLGVLLSAHVVSGLIYFMRVAVGLGFA
jgi:hypothetical protein